MTIPRLLIDLMNIRHLIVDTSDGFDWASSLINYRFVTRLLPVGTVTPEFVPNFLNTIADCVRMRASQVSCSPIAFFITPGIRNRRGARGYNRRANFSLSVVILTFTWIRCKRPV